MIYGIMKKNSFVVITIPIFFTSFVQLTWLSSNVSYQYEKYLIIIQKKRWPNTFSYNLIVVYFYISFIILHIIILQSTEKKGWINTLKVILHLFSL